MKIIHDKFLIVLLMVIFVVGVSGCSSGKKGEYRGFVPVSRTEAESFAEQLIANFKKGDKSQFFDFLTDCDACDAATFFDDDNGHSPKMYFFKDISEQNRKAWPAQITETNHKLYDSMKQVELVEVYQKGDTYGFCIDRQTARQPVTIRSYHVLVKKKDSGKVFVCSTTQDK